MEKRSSFSEVAQPVPKNHFDVADQEMMHSLDLLLLFYQEKRRSQSAAVSRGKPRAYGMTI
ncbi:hypothetical protein ACFOG5_05980 [Pedobacter fastidiosus]|uniref:hypothetical protein n=1 Tax=Pedobacter fastidiosus TaxID=2765361 RepID=UPI0036220B68